MADSAALHSPTAANPATTELAHHNTSSTMSDDPAVPIDDPTSTTGLLAERLQAWKHAVAYLEDYVGAHEKVEKAHAKEYEKVLKTISNPLREGHHFDQQYGGVASLFENMRTNTQGLINSHAETEKNLKGTILPVLDRLHKEIKHKSKELSSGAVKSAKEVEKARNTTQKHIELLGQHTASYESSGSRLAASDDPYVIRRGVYHRLHKQLLEENNARQDLISVQTNFQTFEQHVLEVIQQTLGNFNQLMGGQAQKDLALYSDIAANAQAIPLDFEWKGFQKRASDKLVDPNAPPRGVDDVHFPNQDHKGTKPLIEGTLERKSRNKLSFSGYTAAHYVVTPSKFLHEFKDDDNTRHDPVPELSIYLPDAIIGTVSGDKFNVKGKDVSKGISSKLSGSSELHFKAKTAADAELWAKIIKEAAGAGGGDPTSPLSPIGPTSPTSPTDGSAPANAGIARTASQVTAPPKYVYQGGNAGAEKPIGTGDTVVSSAAPEKAVGEPAVASGAAPAATTTVPVTSSAAKEETV